MPLDIPSGATAPPIYPLQFINIEITPLIDGKYSVAMQATLLDEERLDFIGHDLAHEHRPGIAGLAPRERSQTGPTEAEHGTAQVPQSRSGRRRGQSQTSSP